MNASRARVLLAPIALAVAVTTLTTGAAEKGDLLLRLRGVYVQPRESAEITVIGGDVDITSDVVPEINISYFFSPNWAVELMAATTQHDVDAVETAAGTIDLGNVRLLPPTLTLQYHLQLGETIRPYIGVGVNHTWFYNDDLPDGIVTRSDYQDTLGWVLQAGVDVELGGNWVFNMDLKKVMLDTDVALTTAVGDIKADVEIDPWIFGIGIGYRF